MKKKKVKNIATYYKTKGTPIFRDTTALPFLTGGPLVDKTNHGKLLPSLYASSPGNYYAEGGQMIPPDCGPGQYYDEALGQCVPIKKPIIVESIDDPIYQDYLIRKQLYEHSQVPNYEQRNLATYALRDDPNRLFNYQKFLEKNKDVINNPKSPEYLDDTKGPYGSATSKQKMTPEEFADFQKINNIELSGYERRINELTAKYPPAGYEIYTRETRVPYQYTIGKDNANNWTTPTTAFLEDKINRDRLRQTYPALTDAEIDSWVLENRTTPNYITNTQDNRGKYNWLNGPGSMQTTTSEDGSTSTEFVPTKYPDFNPPTSFIDPNTGEIGYYPDEIVAYNAKVRSYLPYWNEPEPVRLKPIKMELKKPEPISINTKKLAGTPEENLPPEYIAPGYKKDYPAIYWKHHNSSQLIPHARPELTSVFKSTPYSSLVQKTTGYNPEYMEGYTDEEGNYIPGEIESAQQEGRRIEFKGRTGRKDKKAQEEYNRAYDKYEAQKGYEDMILQMYQKGINPFAYRTGGMLKRADGSYSPRGLWDNIRANAGSGKQPTKEMLAQERKISKQYETGGNIESSCPPGYVYLNGNCVKSKDSWGRPASSKWYGFDAGAKIYKEGPKGKEQQKQEKRYEALYGPLEDKFFNALANLNEDPSSEFEYGLEKIMNVNHYRNIPPVDSVLTEMQQKLLNLKDSEIQKLIKQDWGDIGITNFNSYLPSNVSYKEGLKYFNHLKKLKKQGYTYRTGGQFPTPYSLPEDSFKQGGNNLHNSIYASSLAQYPAIYDVGGILGDPPVTPPPTNGIIDRYYYADGVNPDGTTMQTPEGFASSMPIYEPVKVTADAPLWLDLSREYETKNSRQAFIDEKKRKFLKNNKGLNSLYGVDMENFPEQVEKNFGADYDYRKNSYVAKKLGKEKGFNVRRRGEWVDNLTKGERNVIANSRFENKLQPSYWSRSLAGLQEFYGDTFAPIMSSRLPIPGLTKKEQKDIQNSSLGALEALSWWDLPGAYLANKINQAGVGTGGGYREAPGYFSGEKMAGVTDVHAMAMNPLNWALPYDVAAGANALKTLNDVRKFKNANQVRLLYDAEKSAQIGETAYSIVKGRGKKAMPVGEISGKKLPNGDFKTTNIQIAPEFQKQGIGTQAYEQLNKSLNPGNKIKSFQGFLRTAEEEAARQKTWEKLVKEGKAKKVDDTVYEMIPNKALEPEINWAKWNKDTPKYPELINEYNAIEKHTKNSGKWMQNFTIENGKVVWLDGKFPGTKEQFVQLQSSHARKAFPNGFDIVYRGDDVKTPGLIKKPERGFKSVFFANKDLAKRYGTGIDRLTFKPAEGISYDPRFITSNSKPNKGGVYEVAIPKDVKTIHLDAQGRHWNELQDETLYNKIMEVNENVMDKRDKSHKLSKFDKLINSIFGKKTMVEEPHIFSTDDIGKLMDNSDYQRAIITNVHDGGPGTVTLNKHVPGYYAKSLRGNVGFFDMTNPDIYKSVLPYIGVGGIGAGAMYQKGNLQNYKNGGKINVVAGGEKHRVYVKQSPTGMGEGIQGHVMVNHPTMDKGQWDTIDLTAKANAKTIAQGIAATKKWHRENPNTYKNGGGMSSHFYASNVPDNNISNKDLTYPENSYVYRLGGRLIKKFK